MIWASTVSKRSEVASAFAESAEVLGGQLAGAAPDLVVAFASREHASRLDELGELLARRHPGALLVGCTGGGVIGGARELQSGPALSLTAASLPGVELRGFRVEAPAAPGPPDEEACRRAVDGLDPEARLLLLADPFTIEPHALVDGLDRSLPLVVKFGGLASAGGPLGENRLLLGGGVHRGGAVGVAFSGDLSVKTLIAQGCRPIGTPMLVTRCRGCILQELDRRTPLQVLGELYDAASPHDRKLMQSSLFIGLDMREERVEYDPGELLVRNIIGADEESGTLAVGAGLRPLQVVQFVLRDASRAEDELRRLLDDHRRASGGARPAGALLFSCMGRGAGLFGRPDHDTDLLERELGPVPLGGFFCNGEIGPVSGRTFLHGYTSAFALFYPVGPRTTGSSAAG